MRKFIRTVPDLAALTDAQRRQVDAWWDEWGYVEHETFSWPHSRTFDEIVAGHLGQCEVDGMPVSSEPEIALHLIRLIECGLVSAVDS